MATKGWNSGNAFTSLLLLMFVGLKLTHQIRWSWWWVMSPGWIPVGLFMICLLFLGAIKYREK